MILPWLIIIPFVGGLLSWLSERLGRGAPRWIALITMALVFVLSLILWSQGGYSVSGALSGAPHWQAEFQVPWISRFGISFHLALDGLSLLMVILTGILGVLAVLCSWKEIEKGTGAFQLNLMWSLAGVIGVFLAVDMFLFFTFWELMLIPTYFMIALWGRESGFGITRTQAAIKMIIFTQTAGLLLLVAILGLVFTHYQATGHLTFEYGALINTPMSSTVEFMLMLGFFLAFTVKLPMVPFHSWLPDAHALAPTASSVDIAGLLAKVAGYGLLRFVLPFFPHAAHEFAPVAMWLGVLSIFYGAFLAFAQKDIKRLVAFTTISHMGFILVAVFSASVLALQGAVVQMVASAISGGALFIICGEIYERFQTRDMDKLGGFYTRFRALPPITMFFALAALGLPGMGNFIGEFLILFGSFQTAPVQTVVAAGGLILASVYALILIQRVLHGPVSGQSSEKVFDLDWRETAMLFSLMAILLFVGLYPQSVLDTSHAAMTGVHAVYSHALSTASNIAP